VSDADYVEYVQGRLTWLRRVAYLLCQDWHAADDLVQVTITRLFVHWARARRMDNLDGYVRGPLDRSGKSPGTGLEYETAHDGLVIGL